MIVATFLSLFSLLAALSITGLVRFAELDFDLKEVALGSSGVIPIMAVLAMIGIVLDGATTGFSENEMTSLPIFGLGSVLALLLAWPANYRLTKWIYKIDRLAQQ